jgi:hypothetical protein
MIKKFGAYLKESSDLELKYYAFDWDDNILHMPTVIHMEQKVGDDWKPVDVSTAKFAEVRHDKENYRLTADSFSEFRDFGPRGKSAFLEDTKAAISDDKLGPSWDAFIECLSSGAIFSIITARGHEPESIKDSVEWIIDNILNDDEKFLLYSNCLKNAYLFSTPEVESYSRIWRNPISKMPLIQEYLRHCDFYGVASDSFAKEFGAGSSANPEVAKQNALDKFIEKCNNFGSKIGAKSVSVGFSDDDPKNVEHVKKFFNEKSALDWGNIKLNVYKTTDRTIRGGERTKYRGGEVSESSNQAWGMESSVLPFTKFNNMTQRLYPNSKDAPKDDYHNQIKNQTQQAGELYKEFAYKRKNKK